MVHPVFEVIIYILFCFSFKVLLFLYSGEKGDTGSAGSPGPAGLPGPDVSYFF